MRALVGGRLLAIGTAHEARRQSEQVVRAVDAEREERRARVILCTVRQRVTSGTRK